MKSYYGHAATEASPASVTVREGNQRARMLAHHNRHSPTGFEWGYSGQGPSDLARCILLDAFGTGPCPAVEPAVCSCENVWVDTSYPAFRDAVIANRTQDDDFRLDQTWVIDWVFDYIKATLEIDQEEVLQPQA